MRLRFRDHAPRELPLGLAFHGQAADQLVGDPLGRAAKAAGQRQGNHGGTIHSQQATALQLTRPQQAMMRIKETS